jgi:hypothetical protein
MVFTSIRSGAIASTALVLMLGIAQPAHAAPDRSVTAGAQIPSDTFSFADRAAACTHHVALTGSDSNAGTTLTAAWRTPAKAVATLIAGQTACVHAGTYDVSSLAPSHSGTATAPIGLVAAAGETRPVLRAATDGSLLEFGPRDAYWVVRGLDLNKNAHDGAAVQVLGNVASATDPSAGPAHHIALRDNLIRDGKAGAAVLIRHAATDVLVSGNEISGHHRWVSGSTVAFSRINTTYLRADANAVNLEGTATGQVARIEVRGNNLHDNGGDGLQCLGVNDDAGASSHDPADLDAVDNRVHHNAEDGLDIKSCQRVSIRGSRSPALTGSAAENKIFSFRPTDESADLPGNHSGGGAIVIHYFARQVLVENTRIWDSCRGLSIGRDDKNGVQDVVVRRNLIFGFASGTNCPGIGLNLILAQRVDIYHNTVTGVPGTALRLAADNGGAWSSNDIDVFDNIIETTGTGVWIDLYRPRLAGFESNRNLYWAPDGSATHFHLDFNAVSLTDWRSNTGQDAASRHGEPRWIDQPAANDYYTLATSPARDAALTTPGENYCGIAPDLGFRESGC